MSARNTYVRSMDGWWKKNPFFVRYMIREGTAVLVALYSILLIVGLGSLAAGKDAYEGWLAALQNPLAVIFHVVALAAALYHMITWFNVSPKATPAMFIGKDPVPDGAITGAQYAIAAVLTVLILVIA